MARNEQIGARDRLAGRLAAFALIASLALVACGISSADSGGDNTTGGSAPNDPSNPYWQGQSADLPSEPVYNKKF